MAILRLSTTARNAAADAIRTLIDADAGPGLIKIYSGTMAANPQTAPAGTLLATLTFSDPAAPSASTGVLTFSAITEDSSADATNTATWARITDNSGDAVFDVDVTATGGGGTIEINTTSIVSGGPVRITSFTFTVPQG